MRRAHKKRENENIENSTLSNPPFVLVESFRNLTTNIGFAIPRSKERKGRIVCISSAIAGEGKSTVAANLALSCANIKARTIILDCDLRKPSIKNFFHLNNEKGMTDYLSGEAGYEEVLLRNVKRNLDVIACRKVAPNPLALLGSENFKALLEKLAEEYDYIIIDTPPLCLVSDALTVGGLSDGIILVVRQMITRHPALQQTISDIDFAGINLLGFVMNDYKLKDMGKGYYKRYNYKYNAYKS